MLWHSRQQKEEKAEMKHKESLKLQKNKKEELMKKKWDITAGREALFVGKREICQNYKSTNTSNSF